MTRHSQNHPAIQDPNGGQRARQGDSVDSRAPPKSRREFLSSICLKIVKTAEVACFAGMAASIPIMVRLVGAANETKQRGMLVQPESRMVSSSWQLRGGTILAITGVIHIEPMLASERARIKEAVRQAHIVCMESEHNDPRHHRRSDSGYFHIMREIVREERKELYDVDVVSNIWIPTKLAPILAGAAGLHLYAIDPFARKVLDRAMPLRGLLRTLGWVGLATGICAPQELPAVLSDRSPTFGTSFIIDGRTVLMLQRTLEIAAANPGKRVLLLSGNGHAEGFDFYLRNPGYFQVKQALYSRTYQPVYGCSSEKVIGPDGE